MDLFNLRGGKRVVAFGRGSTGTLFLFGLCVCSTYHLFRYTNKRPLRYSSLSFTCPFCVYLDASTYLHRNGFLVDFFWYPHKDPQTNKRASQWAQETSGKLKNVHGYEHVSFGILQWLEKSAFLPKQHCFGRKFLLLLVHCRATTAVTYCATAACRRPKDCIQNSLS